jgi:7-carboxy-7-deazaguanine synthase
MSTIPVMELFYTIQGEGVHAGKPAFFIRLGGCDIGCHWCDVKESWDAKNHPSMTVEMIVDAAKQSGANMVVITGGEPLMYDLAELTKALKHAGFKIHLETAGANPLTGVWDWICISPKKNKQPLVENLSEADELKVIIYNQSDFSWAEKWAEFVDVKCAKLLQPEWSKQEAMQPKIIAYAMDHNQWQISLQTHKFLNIP